MKKFLIHILKTVLIFIILAYFLDFSYTFIYSKSAPRSKITWLKQSFSKKDSLEYVLLGSSRCIHSLNSKTILEKTGKKGLNLAYPSTGPFEVKLMLQEVIKNTNTKKVFIQIDYSFNQISPDNLAKINWLPYLTEDNINKEFERFEPDYFYYNYIPFYKYLKFDSKIGFRNLFLSVSGKKINTINNLGFKATDGILKEKTPHFYTLKREKNIHIEEIISLCKENNIELMFFTAPVFNFEGNHKIFENSLNNYTDFSNAYSDITLFKDHTHLNTEGAIKFTELFIQTYF
ncbi:hypothetical protein [Aureivirga marina]|uniref:hypothetical protein n=1 Tax=Aureivirga marina TaxID=1182451 RepID=UPI0018CBEC6C|nr:hypothetical protein [Aureivirga marina]